MIEDYDTRGDDNRRIWIMPDGDLRMVPDGQIHSGDIFEIFGDTAAPADDARAVREDGDDEDGSEAELDALEAALDAGWIRAGFNPMRREFFAGFDPGTVTTVALRRLKTEAATAGADHYVIEAGLVWLQTGDVMDFARVVNTVIERGLQRRIAAVEPTPDP